MSHTFTKLWLNSKDFQPRKIINQTKGTVITRGLDHKNWCHSSVVAPCAQTAFAELGKAQRSLRVLVLGQVKPEHSAKKQIRVTKNKGKNAPAYFEDVGSHLVPFDVEGIPLPDGYSWAEPQAILRWVVARLEEHIPALKGASVYAYPSSSAGARRKPGVRVHAWFWFDQPIFEHERKQIYQKVSDLVDTGVWTCVRKFLISRPEIAGDGPDPVATRKPFIRLTHAAKKADLCLDEQVMKRAHRSAAAGSEHTPADLSQFSHGTTDFALLEDLKERLRSAQSGNIHRTCLGIGWEAGEAVRDSLISVKDALALSNVGLQLGWDKDQAVTALRDMMERGAGARKDEIVEMHPRPAKYFVAEDHRRKAEEWVDTVRCGEASRWAITGALGVGKTTATLVELGKEPMPGKVGIVCAPSHDLVDEMIEKYCRYQKGGPDAFRRHGRSFVINPSIMERSCRFHETAKDLAKNKWSVTGSLCKLGEHDQCEHADSCAYWREMDEIFEAIQSSKNGVLIFTTTQQAISMLRSKKGKEVKPDFHIIDEALPGQGVSPPVKVPVGLFGCQERIPNANFRSIDLEREVGEILQCPETALFMARFLFEDRAELEQAIDALKSTVASTLYLGDEFEVCDENGNALRQKSRGIEQRDCPAERILEVLKAILSQYDAKRDSLQNVTYIPGDEDTPPMVHLRRRRKLPFTGAVLYLDGTADPEITRRQFEDIEIFDMPVQIDATVIYLEGRDGKGFLTSPDGEPVIQKLSRLRDRFGGFSVAPHALVGSVGADAHYNNLRGLNRWEDRQVAFLISREEVPATEGEDLAAALWEEDDSAIVRASQYDNVKRGLWMKDGTTQGIKTRLHPDDRVQRVLAQPREAELLQAAYRVRPVTNSGRLIIIYARVVLPLEVDYVSIPSRFLKEIGGKVSEAIEEKGYVPRSPRLAAAKFPDLWRTRKAAEKCSALSFAFNKRVAPNAYRLLYTDLGTLAWITLKPRRGGHPVDFIVTPAGLDHLHEAGWKEVGETDVGKILN